MDRGVECSELMTFSPDDGGTFFGFADPDGNTWAVQELKVRGEKPLIPPEDAVASAPRPTDESRQPSVASRLAACIDTGRRRRGSPYGGGAGGVLGLWLRFRGGAARDGDQPGAARAEGSERGRGDSRRPRRAARRRPPASRGSDPACVD